MGRVEALVLTGVLSMVGCSEVREPVVDETRNCGTTWQEDIQPLVTERCASCHSGVLPSGNYSIESYPAALGSGTDDVPNVIQGDGSSRILTALAPGAVVAHTNIPGLEEVRATLESWVVTCQASYFNSDVHTGGILNPHDEDEWHGNLVEDTYGWDLTVCAQCHGEDFAGGPAQSACTTCHTEEGGPTACSTCHALPPASGAHPGHALGRTTGEQIACSECHVVPQRWDDEGHIRVDDQPDRAPAEVTFGPLANANPHNQRTGPANYANGSCTNVYCHGGAFTDAANTLDNPTWEMQAQTISCTACHAVPPSDHVERGFDDFECSSCHGAVRARGGSGPTGSGWTAQGLDLHINGTFDLGRQGGTPEQCNACHGTEETPAPVERDAQVSNELFAVGAHRSHVLGTSGITTPLACSQCHPVIDSVQDPDHLDGKYAEVFPGTADFDRLAYKDSADVTFTVDAGRTQATCTNYCHGSGQSLLEDASASIDRTPGWTEVGMGKGSCGSCHGAPPRDATHDFLPGPINIQQCSQCHPNTMDPAGNFIFTGEGANRTTKHINGVKDVGQ